MKRKPPIALIGALLPLLPSCSTTRALPEGSFRLAENRIIIDNDKGDIPKSELAPYLKQRSNTYFLLGWNPFLNIYNWANPDSDDGWSRFCRKIGQKPVALDESSVSGSVSNLTGRLRYLGWYNSTVKSNITYRKRRAVVTYNVSPGERYRIDDIRFSLPDGSSGEFAEDFLRDTANILIHRGDWLSEQLMETESVRSTAAMRDKGYYDFNKNHYFFVADTLQIPGKLILDYTVRDYTRNESPLQAEPIRKFRIGDVTIEHSPEVPFREKVLLGLNNLHPGDIYSERAVNTVYSRMSALKLFNSVSVEMTPSDTATVDCRIRLAESAIQGFKFNLEGSISSLGLWGISPKFSYFHKNIFHGGEWLNLNLQGNFQFKFKDAARSTEAAFSTTLSFPKFLGLPYSVFKGPRIPRTEVGISFGYQNRTEFQRLISSVNYGYFGMIGDRYQYQFSVPHINFVYLYDLNPDFEKILDTNPMLKYAYQNHFDAGIGGSLFFITDSDLVPKTSYSFFRAGFDLSGNVISLLNPVLRQDAQGQALVFGSPYSQYVRFELNAGKVFRFGREEEQAIAMRGVIGAGYAYGNSSAMPFEKQFWCGGANSMRGWAARALGPGGDPPNYAFSIPSQTGDTKFEIDIEYRRPLFWKFEFAAFAECGNVWNIKSEDPDSYGNIRDCYKTLAADWGLGLRLNLDFILVRVDAGFQLYDPVRAEWHGPSDWFEKGFSSVHFGVGYPF